MPVNDQIRQAAEAIGKNKEADYRLKLSDHLAELSATAPELVAILESSVVTGTRQQYEKKDRKAIDAQNQFTQVFNRANTLVLTTAILTALVLTVGVLSTVLESFSKGFETALLMALTIGSVAAGAFASKDLYMVRQGKLLEEWMLTRAAAESKRLDYFKEVINADVAQAENSVQLNLLKLEYFRRFQLETQLTFFDLRGEDKRQAANKNLKQSGLAVAGAAVITGTAAISASADPKFAAIASLGAVFSAISSYTALKEQIFQNQRISERYAATFDLLEDIYKRVDSTREAVLQTGLEPLQHFMDSVHEILISEHKQWLNEQEQGSQSLAKLDELLAKSMVKKESQRQPEIAQVRPQQQAVIKTEPPAPEQGNGDEQPRSVQSQQTTNQPDKTENVANASLDDERTVAEETDGSENGLQPEVVAEEETAENTAMKTDVPEIKKETGLFQ